MHDDPDALFLRVRSQGRQVVVGIGPSEGEGVAVLDPVAVPADVPPFDQHAPEAVGRREIDVALGVLRGGAVLRPGAPGHGVDVHPPPDADVLHRLDPAGVRDAARRIELEAEERGRQVGDAIGHLDGAPWGLERRAAADLDAIGHGGERGPQEPGLGALLPQEHAGVVHQVGLVDHHEGASVLELHGERRLHAVEHAHRSRRVEHLRAVHPGPVRRDPPGPRVVGQVELGQLVADLEPAQPRLLRQLVTEADAVIEGANAERKPSPGAAVSSTATASSL